VPESYGRVFDSRRVHFNDLMLSSITLVRCVLQGLLLILHRLIISNTSKRLPKGKTYVIPVVQIYK
jgi:hypothetical protein